MPPEQARNRLIANLAEVDYDTASSLGYDCGQPLDVDEIERKWLQTCGSCDAGMSVECRCPDEDHRIVISELVAEVRRLRNVR